MTPKPRFVDDDLTLPRAGTHLGPVIRVQNLDLRAMPAVELMALRVEIDTILPVLDLNSVNMEHELLLQLMVVKKLQKEVLEDDDIPANQRAQCAGQVAAVLGTLAKMQNSIYESERIKAIENHLVEAVKTLTDDQQTQFFERYEAMLRGKA